MTAMTLEIRLDQLHEAALSDPSAVPEMARELLVVAAGDDTAVARILRSLGLARLRMGEPVRAIEALDRALEVAKGLAVEAEVQMSRVGPLAELGRTDEARRAADLSVALARGLPRARAEVQRAILLFRMLGTAEPIEALNRVERSLAAAGDTEWLGRMWSARANMRAMLGDPAGAETDMWQAVGVWKELGVAREVSAAMMILAEFAADRGDLVGALRLLDEVESLGTEDADSLLSTHRGSVYLAAQLVTEAISTYARGVKALDRAGFEMGRAECMLLLAEALRLADRLDDAAVAAAHAETMLDSHGRPGWGDYARLLKTEIEASRTGRLDPVAALGQAETVTATGFTHNATAIALRIIELAIQSGGGVDQEVIASWLRRASRLKGVDLAIQVAHIRALAADAEGDLSAARKALTSGMKAFEEHQAALGATEARVQAARRLSRLANTGLAIAHRSGRFAELFKWMERTRAGALRVPPVLPPDDDGLVRELSELRMVEARIRTEGASPELTARERDLTRSIRHRAMAADGTGDEGAGIPSLESVVDRLGQGVLVEFESIGGRIIGCGVSKAGRNIWDAGSAGEISAAVDDLRFGIRRLVAGRGSRASVEAAWAGVRDTGRALGDRLFAEAPLGLYTVISPCSFLYALPWSALERLAARPVVVTPSARIWMRPPVNNDPSRVVLVAGPDLEHADQEVVRLGSVHRRAITFTSSESRIDSVVAAVDGAGLAHLACHGTFRAESPLFSSLLLADGGLNVYVLERLPQPPAVVVLSACDSGLTGPRPGNELMGLSAALLGGGTRTVVATVGLFPDSEATINVMERLHIRLALGIPPADALAGVETESPAEELARLSTICLGA